MPVLLRDVVNGGPDRYGHSPISPDANNRIVGYGVFMPKDVSMDLREILENGVTQVNLTGMGGTLHVTNNTQLISDPNASSEGFCVVHLKYPSGRSITFEIDFRNNDLENNDLAGGYVTVARKSNIDPRMPKKTAFLNAVGHEDMLPTLAGSLHEAKILGLCSQSNEATAAEQISAVRAKFVHLLREWRTFLTDFAS